MKHIVKNQQPFGEYMKFNGGEKSINIKGVNIRESPYILSLTINYDWLIDELHKKLGKVDEKVLHTLLQMKNQDEQKYD